MSRLEEAGLVSSIKDGRTVRYSIVNMQSMSDALKMYHPNVWDKMLSRFADLFLQMASKTAEKDTDV